MTEAVIKEKNFITEIEKSLLLLAQTLPAQHIDF